jgi:small subunit ribosomal protein S8
MLTDPLANVMNVMMTAQRAGKVEVTVSPVSTVIKRVLDMMHEHKYVGKVELITDKEQPTIKIQLIGTLNKCAVVKPRFSVTKDGYEKFEKRYLPAKDVGVIVVSTSQGMMTHAEAKKKGLGGSLVAYFY